MKSKRRKAKPKPAPTVELRVVESADPKLLRRVAVILADIIGPELCGDIAALHRQLGPEKFRAEWARALREADAKSKEGAP